VNLFSYVDLEERVPKNHPLRLIRRIVNEVLAALDREFASIAGAVVAGAFVAGALHHPLGYNLLYRWFVGLASGRSALLPRCHSTCPVCRIHKK
jgi:hypothetical protein